MRFYQRYLWILALLAVVGGLLLALTDWFKQPAYWVATLLLGRTVYAPPEMEKLGYLSVITGAALFWASWRLDPRVKAAAGLCKDQLLKAVEHRNSLCLLLSLALSLSVSRRLQVWWEMPTTLRISLLVVTTVLAALAIHFLIFRLLFRTLQRYSVKSLLQWLSISMSLAALALAVLDLSPPPPPRWHTLKVVAAGTRDDLSTGYQVEINQMLLEKKPLSPNYLRSQGNWNNKENRWSINSEKPSALIYRFPDSGRQLLELQFATGPEAGEVWVFLDRQRHYFDLYQLLPGEMDIKLATDRLNYLFITIPFLGADALLLGLCLFALGFILFRQHLTSEISKTRDGLPGINLFDATLLLAFLCFAILYFIARLQSNYPYYTISGDAANLSSFAAAMKYPQNFEKDLLISQSRSFEFYATVQIPLLQWLESLMGNYGLAFGILLIPTTFIHLLGYYILGRVLLKSRYWGLLLSLITAMPVLLGFGEFWGIYQDALPRFMFQAILPYLLTLLLKWQKKPVRWLWVMGLTGLMMYVHPVSTPSWAVAIWISLWFLQPKGWSIRKRLIFMFGAGFAFLLPAIPFAFNYLGSHSAARMENQQLARYVLENFMFGDVFTVRAPIKEFFYFFLSYGIYPLSLLSVLVIWLEKGQRHTLYLTLTWIIGVMATCIAVTWVERRIEQALGILPVQIELLRGLRYGLPFMQLFILWSLRVLSVILKPRPIGFYWQPLASVIVGAWIILHPVSPSTSTAIDCIKTGKLVCQASGDYGEAIAYLRQHTPPDSAVFCLRNANGSFSDVSCQEVRYLALRSLVYTFKDRGVLTYNNHAKLLVWYDTYQALRAMDEIADPAKQLEMGVSIARNLKADYILSNMPLPASAIKAQGLERVFGNQPGQFCVYRIHAN
ncbi:MAG: hypothetical protein HPY45_00060 [Anaerolineae bacterium]|nr:hypothetical protein [Anaerolineae bacterium]